MFKVSPHCKLPNQNVEDYDNIINDAKEWLERGKVEGFSPRGFILANGDLVDNQKLYPDSPYNTPPHDAVSRHMLGYLAKKYDVPFDEMADFFYDPVDDGSRTAIDYLGAIRVNGANENYICIPKYPISSAQARTLEEWIDAFVSKFPQAYLYVTTQDGKDGRSFFPDKGIIGRDVVRAIRRYYTSGVLTEDKEKDHK